MNYISNILLLLFTTTCTLYASKVPICPHKMFDASRASGAIVSTIAPNDTASPIISMHAYHNATSCRYNKDCILFDFCMAGIVNITFGRERIEIVYYFFVRAVTIDEYIKITQETTLKHMEELRVRPVSVSFMPLNSKIKSPSSDKCKASNKKSYIRDVCKSGNNAAESYSKDHGNMQMILSKTKTRQGNKVRKTNEDI